jgi:hypothetical protein
MIRDGISLVMPGLVPGIPILETQNATIGIAGTRPAMTPRNVAHER